MLAVLSEVNFLGEVEKHRSLSLTVSVLLFTVPNISAALLEMDV